MSDQVEETAKPEPVSLGDFEVVAMAVPYNGVCASCGHYKLVCRDVMDPNDEAICQACLAFAMGETAGP